MTSSTTRRRRRGAALGAAAIIAASTFAASAPASGHASAPAAATFGFEPNPAGGTGSLGGTPPYAPGAFTTIYLRAAGEQTTKFNGSDDTNVEVRAIVPAGWTDAQCGPAKLQVNNASTNNTNQPGPDVPGWSCEVLTESGHEVVRWSGPQVVSPQTVADSPAFFVFSVRTPSPATQTTYDGTNGTEGFIVDQKYASGAVSHWIPNAAYPGTAPVGTTRTDVATGLVRTVAGAGSGFTSVAPSRVLDSRSGTGWTGALAAGTPRTLTVAGGSAVVPSGAEAVVLNVTVTGASADGYLTVFPTGATQPNASNLNFTAGRDVANLVVVKVGTGGQISFANAVGSTQVIADLVGWFSTSGTDRYRALDPTRVLDSRNGTGGLAAALGAGASHALTVRGVAGIPATADAVVLNLTATGATTDTFVTLHPSDTAAPNASNLNVGSGRTVANLAIVKIGADGKVAVRNERGTVDVIADVVGWFDTTSGDLFHAVTPGRVLDSRLTTGGWNARLDAPTAKPLKVRGAGGVRLDASAVLANATVTAPTAPGYLTVFPTGATVPNASTLNFTADANVPNLVITKVGSGGQVSFAASNGSTHVLFDVVGYFAAS